MRLFAAICVVEFHVWWNYLGVAIGHPGTDYFFVLVGFVAAYSQFGYIAKGKWSHYLADRAIRIYVAFIPLFLIDLFFKRRDATWDWVWRSFFFIPQGERLPVIGPTWMMSHFWLFYVIFAIVIWSRHESLVWWLFALWAIGIVAYLYGGWRTYLPPEWAELLFYERNLDFIFGYAAGTLLRRQIIRPYWARWCVWLGAAGVVVGTIVLNVDYLLPGRSLWLGLPVTLFVFGIAALEQSNTSSRWVSFLTWRWLVYFGAASYVIYLSHGLTIGAWNHVFPITPLWTPVVTICALLVGVLAYRLWEAPMIEHIKQRLHFTDRVPKRTHTPEPALTVPSRTSPSFSADGVAVGANKPNKKPQP